MALFPGLEELDGWGVGEGDGPVEGGGSMAVMVPVLDHDRCPWCALEVPQPCALNCGEPES